MLEEQRVRELWKDIDDGNRTAGKFEYHEPTRSLRPCGPSADPDRAIPITKMDADLFGHGRAMR
jgi:hypothetical protein